MFSICLFEIQKGFQIYLLHPSPPKAINLLQLNQTIFLHLNPRNELKGQRNLQAPALFLLPNIPHGL